MLPNYQKVRKKNMEKNVAQNASAPAKTAGAGFIPNMDEVLSSSKSRTSGGTKIRANIGYTLVAEGVRKLIGTPIPDQEKVILSLMNGLLSADKPVVSEPDLHAAIVAAHAAGRLKTKQEPWHIFRYYRTALKTAGVLREVPVAVAA